MAKASPLSLMLRLPSLPFLFTFTLFLFMVFKLWKGTKAHKTIPKLPPGPWKLPLIGNLHQLIGSLPHHSLTNLAKRYGPIMHLQLGEASAVIISSPEAAKEVLKTHELTFAQRPEFHIVKIMSYDGPNLIFAPYGDFWRQMRKICVLELLSTKRVKSFRSIREEEVNSLIEYISLSQGHPINLSEKIYSLTNNITARAAFGKKCKDQDEFISALKETIVLSRGFEMPDMFPSLGFLSSIIGIKPSLKRVHRKTDKILENIINDHKEKRKSCTTSNGKPAEEEDLVDVLLNLQESSELDFQITTNNIKAIIKDIFSAGSESTATTLEWAISELLRNPRMMEKAQAEVRQLLERKGRIEDTDMEQLDYLKLVIKETLRLRPPTFFIPREARQKCEIGGYDIPFKTKVIINIWAIGRDQDHWANADCFQPERFHESSIDFKGSNYEFLPFGAGRRICPAIVFASSTMEFALAQLLCHFDWKLPNGMKKEELDMAETIGVTTRRSQDLHLIATPVINSIR